MCVLCSNVNRFEFDANVNFSINNFHVNYIYTCKFILSIFLSIFPTLFFLYPAFLIESRIVLSLRIEKKNRHKIGHSSLSRKAFEKRLELTAPIQNKISICFRNEFEEWRMCCDGELLSSMRISYVKTMKHEMREQKLEMLCFRMASNRAGVIRSPHNGH